MHIRITFSSSHDEHIYSSDIPKEEQNEIVLIKFTPSGRIFPE